LFKPAETLEKGHRKLIHDYLILNNCAKVIRTNKPVVKTNIYHPFKDFGIIMSKCHPVSYSKYWF